MSAFEPMQMFLVDVDGKYGDPLPVNSEQDLLQAIVDNVEKFHELRLVDMLDRCTMQVVDRSLVFPVPDERHKNNKWDAKDGVFKT